MRQILIIHMDFLIQKIDLAVEILPNYALYVWKLICSLKYARLNTINVKYREWIVKKSNIDNGIIQINYLEDQILLE